VTIPLLALAKLKAKQSYLYNRSLSEPCCPQKKISDYNPYQKCTVKKLFVLLLQGYNALEIRG